MGLAATSASNGRHITLTVAGVGVIEADLSADGQTLAAQLKQGPGYNFTLTRGTFAAPARPQMPVPPYPYAAREVTFDNPAPGGGRLAGTLTTPMGAGPFPAVVLITGSGAEDRDETIFGHKPFLVLADALLRLQHDQARAYPLLSYCLDADLVAPTPRLGGLLLEAAQCARALRRPADAIRYYRRYLAEYPHEDRTPEVRRRLAALTGEVAP